MTPLDAFNRELRLLGYAYALVPGGAEACGCDPINKVVYIGYDLDPITIGIVGLHELGHSMNAPTMMMLRLFRPVAYTGELQAWAWAELKMPAGYEEQFNKMKEFGLSSYYYREGQL
jgi:hypothetical protein